MNTERESASLLLAEKADRVGKMLDFMLVEVKALHKTAGKLVDALERLKAGGQ
jgi:hypothetical protein